MGSQPRFAAQSQDQDGVATIALSGELDMATAPILTETLAPFEGNGVSTIILKLEDLKFIDATGLHAILAAKSRALSNGHRLLLREPSPGARRLMKLTDTLFLLDDIEGFSGTETGTTGEMLG